MFLNPRSDAFWVYTICRGCWPAAFLIGLFEKRSFVVPRHVPSPRPFLAPSPRYVPISRPFPAQAFWRAPCLAFFEIPPPMSAGNGGGAGQNAKCKAIVSRAAATPVDSPNGVWVLGIQGAHIASSAFGEFLQSALVLNWSCPVERCVDSLLFSERCYEKGSMV